MDYLNKIIIFWVYVFIIVAILVVQYWLSLVIGAMLIVLLCFAMKEEKKRNIVAMSRNPPSRYSAERKIMFSISLLFL